MNVTIQDALATRDCVFMGCVEDAVHGSEFCRDHMCAAARKPRAPIPKGSARSRPSTGKRWTPATICDAIREFAHLHGRPPTIREWEAPLGEDEPLRPSSSAVKRQFARMGGWPSAIEQAGFPRPSKGTRYARGAAS